MLTGISVLYFQPDGIVHQFVSIAGSLPPGRLWVTNTLTDILLRKLVMYSSEGVPTYPNSKHKVFGTSESYKLRGFKG
jgi:hypothetical protein